MQRKIKVKFIAIIALFFLTGLISYPEAARFVPPIYTALNKLKLNLGLDLQGGIHLEYKADISGLESNKVEDALQSAQDVIERRINAFGVGESLVQTSKSGEEYRIVVELPGIKDIEEAKKKIKEAPLLEFKEEGEIDPEIKKVFDDLNIKSKTKAEEILARAKKGDSFEDLAKEFSSDPGSKENGGDLGFVKKGNFVSEFDEILFNKNLKPGEIYESLVETEYGWHIIKFVESKGEGDDKEVSAKHILFSKQNPENYQEFKYKETGLTGKNLTDVQVVFPQGQGIGTPEVSIKFDEEGTRLFAEITKRNIGKPLAIFLDGQFKSSPTINSEISNGEAVISGDFSFEEANGLKSMINEGSIPVPLELVSQQNIEASLGEESLNKILKAGMMGLAAVIIFMIFLYRFLGLVASLGLIMYATIMISVFKLSGSFTPWPITLTLSGIAGFILTMGMAVDANVLVFERMREEIESGKNLGRSLEEGFRRAWPSIRDGNYSTILTSLILIWVGTSFVKGFALILTIGVLMSMFTAIVLVKNMLRFFLGDWAEKRMWLILGTGKDKNISENK
ncbi:MAG: Protein-export membrane protein SecD [uncultured bacterium]|nr:MAG: Protein-export membrane protein SecD [uncultured bacterium]